MGLLTLLASLAGILGPSAVEATATTSSEPQWQGEGAGQRAQQGQGCHCIPCIRPCSTDSRSGSGDPQAAGGQLHQRAAEGDTCRPKARVPGEEARCSASGEGQAMAKVARRPQAVLCQGEDQIPQGHEQDRARHLAGQCGAQPSKREPPPSCCRGFQYGISRCRNNCYCRRGLRSVVGWWCTPWCRKHRYRGGQSWRS